MVMKKLAILLALSFNIHAFAQEFYFRIAIDSIQVPELGGLQSYAIGQADGKWLIFGGRLDGLHRRQPWATFDVAGHNNQIIVVDPVNKQKWTSSLSSLDTNLREQLSSSNMQFVQRENILFLLGGYGYSAVKDDHISFPNFTTVEVPGLINAVIQGKSINQFFHQINDEKFALCGGQMMLLDNDLYVVGGNRFDGKYNPMDNPTFVQTYSHSVQRYSVELNGLVPRIFQHPSYTDEKLMRKRDFNVQPTILENGEQALISFSGVFQKEYNMPHINAVLIDKNGMKEVQDFAQYYNHYHCANTALYDARNKSTHHLFFGGIAHYYDSSGMLVQDNDVPFTPAVTYVHREANGKMTEYKMPIKLPGYLGAASEFIPAENIPQMTNEIIDLSQLQNDSILLGYLYGGIKSSAANIFWINTGVESTASQMIYPIYLIKSKDEIGLIENKQSSNGLQLQVFPVPLQKEIIFLFNLKSGTTAIAELFDRQGKLVKKKNFKKLAPGKNEQLFKFRKLKMGDEFLLKFTVNSITVEQYLIVR
jgi:hypothetical protein